jgi:hypothetical protein
MHDHPDAEGLHPPRPRPLNRRCASRRLGRPKASAFSVTSESSEPPC